jgi:phage gp16-like protein
VPVRKSSAAAADRLAGARRRDLADIHMAKKALGWGDEIYRDVMMTVINARSSSELDQAGRKRWIDHLQACLKQAGQAPAKAMVPWTARHKQMWSLWQQLADKSLIEDRTRTALDAWVKRQTGVDLFNWLNEAQLGAVIDAAKGWLARGS